MWVEAKLVPCSSTSRSLSERLLSLDRFSEKRQAKKNCVWHWVASHPIHNVCTNAERAVSATRPVGA